MRPGFGPGGPLPHEPFGPAVRRRPLVGGVDSLVVDLPHHALLIFRCQQRQQRRDLVGARVVPDSPSLRRILAVHAVPSGHRFVGVPGWAAARPGVGDQRLIMLFRRLEWIRAHDVLARPIHLAVSPAGRRWRLAPDARVVGARAGSTAAHVGDLPRGVAAPVAHVRPARAVLVEVLAREHVHGQRRHAIGRTSIPLRTVSVAAHVRRWIHRGEWCASEALDLRRLQLRPRVRCASSQQNERHSRGRDGGANGRHVFLFRIPRRLKPALYERYAHERLIMPRAFDYLSGRLESSDPRPFGGRTAKARRGRSVVMARRAVANRLSSHSNLNETTAPVAPGAQASAASRISLKLHRGHVRAVHGRRGDRRRCRACVLEQPDGAVSLR